MDHANLRLHFNTLPPFSAHHLHLVHVMREFSVLLGDPKGIFYNVYEGRGNCDNVASAVHGEGNHIGST